MPSFNPKHLKKRTTLQKEIGSVQKTEKCSVSGCVQNQDHHLAHSNLEGYLSKLNWSLNYDEKKSRSVGLCRNHYKEYKKLKDKDDKYFQYKEFGPKMNPLKRDKSFKLLE